MSGPCVLDPRIGDLPPDAEVGVVAGMVATVFGDQHVSFQKEKYDVLLMEQGFGTVSALLVLELEDLLEMGLSRGHAKIALCALFPPEVKPLSTAVVVPDSPYSSSPRSRSGPELCELTATGAPSSKGFRAWMITFAVFIRQRVDDSTLKAIQLAASEPLKVGVEWLTSTPATAEQSRIVFDALVGCGPKGLPADLLLSFSPEILNDALGVAAIAFISRMVLIVTDEGAAVLQAWFSQPPPVTKKWMLGPALVQWLRTREQLVDCDCAPSEVSCRLSLFHLVSKIPELIPEIAALRVAAGAGGIVVSTLVDLVRAKGEAFNSEKQTQIAVANMCFAGVADAAGVDESAVVCRYWKLGTCRWGDKCKWKHDGPAGIATIAKRHGPRGKGSKKSEIDQKSSAHDLKALLLELLSGIATKIDCTVFSLLTKICGRVQTRQKTQLSPQISQISPQIQILYTRVYFLRPQLKICSQSFAPWILRLKSKKEGTRMDGHVCPLHRPYARISVFTRIRRPSPPMISMPRLI